MAPVDLAEISFFELDRLFNESARAVQRRLRRKKKKKDQLKETGEAGNDAAVQVVSPSRSRTPPKRLKFSKIPAFGGFTGCVVDGEKCVVVSGVPPASDEKELYILFSKCGTVNDVHVMENRLEQRTGIAVVEFQEDEAATRATLMGPPLNELHGSLLQVKKTEPKKEGFQQPKKMMTRSQFTQQVLSGLKTAAGGALEGPSMRKLNIKNLRSVVTEDDMRGIFKPFGDFEDFKMGEGECWITFVQHNDAQDALSSMQGFQLVGQELQITMQSVEVAAPPPPAPAPPPPPAETLEKQMAKDTDFNASGVDKEGRMDLMLKLSSQTPGGAAPPPPPPAGQPAPPPPPLGGGTQALPPTPKPGGPTARTLLLQNMFTPGGVDLQKEPKFYEEIREDTREECSKFGKVLHVTVDPRGATGLIYVLYETPSQRQAAELALNGRWFEGKKILANGIDDSIWQALASQAGPGK